MAKSQTKFNKHHQPIVKSPLIIRNETNDKIAAIRARLAQIKAYKRLIAGDGMTADKEDKRLESELIIRLLRLEKSQNPLPRPKDKPEAEAEAKKPVRGERVSRRARGR